MDPHKKPPTPSSAPSWQDQGLEFELTDFESARQVLDSESISQFDVVSIGAPEQQWKRLRRARLPTDRALSGQAIDWLIGLPPGLRPQALSAQFPRIVNALAQAWDDPAECQAVLDGLLHSERKGRKGFAPQVQDELIALQNWVQVF
jgi:hypothetical protein